MAVLAVDPSSKRSGGSLLGDRARIDHDPRDDGVLIRSTAAGGRLGGLAAATREAAEALAPAFDVVVVETVGVGQSETDVEDVCDTVAVVVQPGSGDVLQFLKAGIMEVPDLLVVTKADLGDVARRARRDLDPGAARRSGRSEVPVLAVSSLPPPSGIGELADALDAHRDGTDLAERRVRARRGAALREFTAEHGERALRDLGGRREAERLLERRIRRRRDRAGERAGGRAMSRRKRPPADSPAPGARRASRRSRRWAPDVAAHRRRCRGPHRRLRRHGRGRRARRGGEPRGRARHRSGGVRDRARGGADSGGDLAALERQHDRVEARAGAQLRHGVAHVGAHGLG